MTMTKKSTQLFWHWVSDGRIIFWLNICQLSFPDGYSSCRWAGRSTSLWFCLSPWSARKSKYIRFNAKSSDCFSKNFLLVVVVLFVVASVRDQLIQAMRNSDHEWELSLFTDSILISTPYLPCRQQVATSNAGPILVFPRIQPFGSDDSSSRGKVYSRHVTANCENSSVSFDMKYCPTSTVVRNPASVQNLLNLSCYENFSIRSLYLCKSNSFCVRSSFRGMFVSITLGTNDGSDCPTKTSLPVLTWQDLYSSHKSGTVL